MEINRYIFKNVLMFQCYVKYFVLRIINAYEKQLNSIGLILHLIFMRFCTISN